MTEKQLFERDSIVSVLDTLDHYSTVSLLISILATQLVQTQNTLQLPSFLIGLSSILYYTTTSVN